MLNIYKVAKLDLMSVLREIRPPELLPENHHKRMEENYFRKVKKYEFERKGVSALLNTSSVIFSETLFSRPSLSLILEDE